MLSWEFRDEFVHRLLVNDIPQRIRQFRCRVLGFYDPQNELVGFGSYEISDVWSKITGKTYHAYIPLLAVNPACERRGHGASILRRLIEEVAVIIAHMQISRLDVSPDIFLDVYQDSLGAMNLYKANGFQQIAGPFVDPEANGKEYIVMACRLDINCSHAFPHKPV